MHNLRTSSEQLHVALTLFVSGVALWNLQISVIAQGLFKCHQGNNKVTHMKRPLCGLLYGKH